MAGRDLRRRMDAAVARLPTPESLARWTLGATLVLAGGHKLLDPTAWTVYVVDWLEPLLVVSPRTFMLANGWLELGVGGAVLGDRYADLAAFLAAVSLTATVGYLAVVWVSTGRFGDVLVRDVGLAGLAWAVTVAAFRSAAGGGRTRGE